MTEKKYCHDVSDILDLYIHNELDSYVKEKIEEHIAECDGCRLLLDGESAVVSSVKKFGDETPDIASAVMKRIIDNKMTVDKPKRKFNFAPSLIPAAAAVIAVTLFSRTNIMKMAEQKFDSAANADEVYDSRLYLEGAELKQSENLESPITEGDEAEEDVITYAAPYSVTDSAMGKAADAGDAVFFDVDTDTEISENEALPDQESILLAETEESYGSDIESIGNEIQGMTDEYDEELFNTLRGRLDRTDEDQKDEINTLIILNGENEALLAYLLQDIEYEEINGIIMTDISAFEQFRQNATDNEFDDFKVYQENTDSNVLAFTFNPEE